MSDVINSKLFDFRDNKMTYKIHDVSILKKG